MTGTDLCKQVTVLIFLILIVPHQSHSLSRSYLNHLVFHPGCHTTEGNLHSSVLVLNQMSVDTASHC
jgi:hypothetical protein